MRWPLVLSFILFSRLLPAQNIDVQHYKFELSLSDASDTVKGTATVTVKFETDTDAFPLNFASTGRRKKGFAVQQITDGNRSLLFIHQNDSLRIQLPVPAKKGDVRQFQIRYSGVPADGLIISKNMRDERTFFADNWPNRARQWLPCNDVPNDKASFEFIVTAPARYNVVANGVRIDETVLPNNLKRTHWREEIPLPTKVMAIGVARFAVKKFADSPDSIPVSAWVYPQDSAAGFHDYALAPGILKFFTAYIGPYPYKKLANVQSKTIFGGMENASAIFYDEETVTGDRKSEALIAHEIVHQWFGDMASEKSFAHLWLSEGFATYLTNIYIEKKYGRDSAVARLRSGKEQIIDLNRKAARPVVDSTTDLMSLLNANNYQKGAWVLHMLRTEAGDSIFQRIIQTYYQQYKGGNADTKDFVGVAEKISGKNLKWFFDQWLNRSGIPRLAIKKTKTTIGLQLTVIQMQKDVYRFTLPVSIETVTVKGKTLHWPITERTTSIIVSKDKEAKIVIDPFYSLLYLEE